MKRNILIITFLAIHLGIFSQNENLLYDITDGHFRANLSEMPNSMNDGANYTLLVDNQRIVKFDYKTGNAVETLFDVNNFKDLPFKSVFSYEISPDERKILLATNPVKRYRRSYMADHYVFDIKRKEITLLSENGAQQDPLFSPDSRYIVFARNNNLYMNKLDYGTEIAITKDGAAGKTINGVADWVYEEEFSQTRYFCFSPDSKLLAFIKFDETEVPEFAFQKFNPSGKTDGDLTLYPELLQFKYPKAGQANSKVSVCIYDDFYKQIKTVQLGDGKLSDFYIPRLRWTNSEEQLAIFVLNRNQNQMDMYLANPKSTLGKLVFSQTDEHYVDYGNADYTFFSFDNQYFITVTEQDGWRHAYRYFINGTLDKKLTNGNFDLTNVYGYDEKNKLLYYQAAAVSPLQREVYCVDFKGSIKKLTDEAGTHTANFNADFSLFVDNFSTNETPNIITLKDVKGKIVRTIEDNKEVGYHFEKIRPLHKEFFKFTTPDGVELNGWIVKPAPTQIDKQYPLLLVQYSGPNSQEVLDRWDIDWEYYLAENKIVVACIDGRGTGARGANFRKCTYQQLGVLETHDQIAAAQYLGSQPFVDKNRIGIWGWSYGGFMTLNAMSTGEKVFKAGIAIAPVTDWRFYNTAYTERFMRRPQENFHGYKLASPLLRADKLQGKLLLVHGTADDNVHIQNSMDYAAALVEAGIQFEMQIYPDKNHSILGKNTRRHLYTRMFEFLQQNL
jgi:dipeptidyl-peptidase-4